MTDSEPEGRTSNKDSPPRLWTWRREGQGGQYRASFYVGTYAQIGLVGMVVVCVGAAGGSDPLVAIATLLLVGAAAFLSGGIVGFLFGVPRLLASSNDRASTTYAPNTNLEEISDWLTKVLLGAGLTQVGAIGNALGGVGSFADEELGLPTAMATALVVFYLALGFHFFYVWTRLYLPDLFAEAEIRAQRRRAALLPTLGSDGVEPTSEDPPTSS